MKGKSARNTSLFGCLFTKCYICFHGNSAIRKYDISAMFVCLTVASAPAGERRPEWNESIKY